MTFESLFKTGEEKLKKELVIEKAVAEARKKIQEKNKNTEIAEFFNEKDKQNLQMLKSHPDSDLKKVFEHSRELMLGVKQTPQVIEGRVKFFHPEIS